jgi:hypothetical protein
MRGIYERSGVVSTWWLAFLLTDAMQGNVDGVGGSPKEMGNLWRRVADRGEGADLLALAFSLH